MPKWEKRKLGHRNKHLLKLKKFPGEIVTIANIVRCLDKYYPPEGEFSYGNKTTVETAIIIQEYYGKKIRAYMVKRFKIGTESQEIKHTAEEAQKEMEKRGFIPKEDVDIDAKLPYIRSIVDNNFVYPIQYDLMKTYEVFPLIGISGYTGIRTPRNYHK
jgi:hypothetical protein